MQVSGWGQQDKGHSIWTALSQWNPAGTLSYFRCTTAMSSRQESLIITLSGMCESLDGHQEGIWGRSGNDHGGFTSHWVFSCIFRMQVMPQHSSPGANVVQNTLHKCYCRNKDIQWFPSHACMNSHYRENRDGSLGWCYLRRAAATAI